MDKNTNINYIHFIPFSDSLQNQHKAQNMYYNKPLAKIFNS